MKDELYSLLRDYFGLSDLEARTYLSLLNSIESGLSVKSVSKRIGFSVPKMYSILSSLEDKGLVKKLIGRPVKFIVNPERDDFETLREFLIQKKEEQFYSDINNLNTQVNKGISKFFKLFNKDKVKDVFGRTAVKMQIIKMYLRVCKAFKSGGSVNPRFAIFFEHPPSMLLLQFKKRTVKNLVDKEVAKTVHEIIYSPIKVLIIWYYKNFIEKMKLLTDQDLLVEYLKQVTEHTSKWVSGAYTNKLFIMWPELVNPCSTVYLSSFGDLAMSAPRELSPESLVNIDEFKIGQYHQIDKGVAGLFLDLIEKGRQGPEEIIKVLKEIKKELMPLVKDQGKKKFLKLEYDKVINSLRAKQSQ